MIYNTYASCRLWGAIKLMRLFKIQFILCWQSWCSAVDIHIVGLRKAQIIRSKVQTNLNVYMNRTDDNTSLFPYGDIQCSDEVLDKSNCRRILSINTTQFIFRALGRDLAPIT